MIAPASIAWFTRHEFRLAWREWLWMLTAGKSHRMRMVAFAIFVFALFMHAVAYSVVAKFASVDAAAERGTLVVITGCILLSWSLMMSQAMESVTRVFYARSDLDLILSSPAIARRVFAVRIAAMAASTIVMTLLLASPFINILVYRGGVRWLAAYGVVLAVGATAAALSVALAVALFRTIGPKRTRIAAQIVAAVIGAFFIIGLQVAAILSYGTLSHFAFLQSDLAASLVPGIDSIIWWPARAILGDPAKLAIVLGGGLLLLVGAITIFSARFGEHATAAAGVSDGGVFQRRGQRPFRRQSAKAGLRRKEWTLLIRDPWLASQTLMQLLYLLPPGLMLWRAFGEDAADLVLLVPVLVMAAGQLAGGLAWLAISGEDAPDLVATAPIPESWLVRAKIEAVTGSVAAIFAPFLIAMAWVSPRDAIVSAAFLAVSAVSATLIQLWFRTQARRKHFRRRQTSSRIATFAEAFSSIAWAATAGLAAAGHWQASIVGLIAIGILIVTRAVSPHKR